MIFDTPLQDHSPDLILASYYINILVTIIFTIECIFKCIVYGLISNGPQSYLKSNWNLLDFLIILLSMLSIIFDHLSHLQNSSNKLELVKTLRVLRSVKLIAKSEPLKISLQSLIYAMPGIANLTVVLFGFFMLFGIFFLNLFKGKFYSC